jgi:hypothetical protein
MAGASAAPRAPAAAAAACLLGWTHCGPAGRSATCGRGGSGAGQERRRAQFGRAKRLHPRRTGGLAAAVAGGSVRSALTAAQHRLRAGAHVVAAPSAARTPVSCAHAAELPPRRWPRVVAARRNIGSAAAAAAGLGEKGDGERTRSLTARAVTGACPLLPAASALEGARADHCVLCPCCAAPTPAHSEILGPAGLPRDKSWRCQWRSKIRRPLAAGGARSTHSTRARCTACALAPARSASARVGGGGSCHGRTTHTISAHAGRAA